jgi:hypothetical protein
MSEENVEVIKEALAAWNRDDMDAVMSAMSHDADADRDQLAEQVRQITRRRTSNVRGGLGRPPLYESSAILALATS